VTPSRTASAQDLLGDVLAAGGVRSAYQPIVDLASGAPVGFEALARWSPATSATADRRSAAASTRS